MTDLNKIKATLLKMKSQLDASGISQIGIFGSYLKGEETSQSDVDILIDIVRPTKLDYLKLITIEDQLSKELGTTVDLVLKSSLKPHLGKKILQEVMYL
ncbi:MAG: nucleotidyltransferase family protein [Spirochaetaceae bacterium]|jgi:predicted nucleotidyltransferase|nr:nucleotidyltransferase family protein [Spirochaetaceae bacterium]